MATDPAHAELVQILSKAKDLINTPTKWCKGALARNAKGDPVYECSEEAVCFCATGALRKVLRETPVENASVRSFIMNSYDFITRINDRTSTSHGDILRELDRVGDDWWAS